MQSSQKLAIALVATGLGVAILILVFFSGPTETEWDSGRGSSSQETNSDSSSPAGNTHTLKPLIVQETSADTDEGADLPSAAPSTPPSQPQEQPSQSELGDFHQDQIFERLQLQSRYFFRCYSHLLEVDPNQKGNIVVGFTIDEEGEAKMAQITQSDFDNQAFHRCIIDVVTRTSFPKMTNGGISTLFPLEFE